MMIKNIVSTEFNPGRNTAMVRQSGLSLLELMISLTLGMMLVLGIGTIFIGSNQTYGVQEENARIQEAGRYALEVIGRSIRKAGYWNMPITLKETATGFSDIPIGGTNGAGTAPDTVTIRYDGVAGSDRDCLGNNVAGVVQEDYRLDASEIECDSNMDGATGFQPLIGSSPVAGESTGQEVEDLQILYGIDTDADQSANQYTAAPADWGQVNSARICVLIRSQQQGVSTGNQSYTNCAGALGIATGAAATTTAGDRRLRRTFVATFNLRNRVTTLP